MNENLSIGTSGPVAVKRTPKGWVARAAYRGLDGVVRTRQASGRTRVEARRALREVLVEPQMGLVAISGTSTVAELAVQWLEELRIVDEIGQETFDYYRRGLETLVIRHLGGVRVNELRPVDVKQFYRRVLLATALDGTEVRTPSRPIWAHKIMSLMLQFAVEIGAIDNSPVRDIRPPRRAKKEVQVLTIELFHEVWEAVEAFDQRPQLGPPRSHRLLDVFSLLAGTGARISEVLALRWCDVDFDAEPVRVAISGTLLPPRDGQPLRRQEGTKTTAGMRSLALPGFAADTLRRLRDEATDLSPETPVFVTRNGTWLAPNNIRREWRTCRQGRGWDWITPHSFRKTVATLIDDHFSNPDTGGTEGAGAPVAAAVLGHSSEAVTRTYYIRRMRNAPDVSTVLSGAFGRPDSLAS